MYIEYVLDILKPHQPSLSLLALTLKKLNGVKYINIKVEEIDQKTTSITLIIRGNEQLSLDEVTNSLEEMHCALHSVDRVIVADEE